MSTLAAAELLINGLIIGTKAMQAWSEFNEALSVRYRERAALGKEITQQDIDELLVATKTKIENNRRILESAAAARKAAMGAT
jgi:hypothetical protein